jgi:hypothetical protein
VTERKPEHRWRLRRTYYVGPFSLTGFATMDTYYRRRWVANLVHDYATLAGTSVEVLRLDLADEVDKLNELARVLPKCDERSTHHLTNVLASAKIGR